MKVKDIILHLISTCCIAAGVSACVTNEMIVPEVESNLEELRERNKMAPEARLRQRSQGRLD